MMNAKKEDVNSASGRDPEGAAVSVIDEARRVAARLRPRPASALSRFGCSNAVSNRPSPAVAALNAELAPLATTVDERLKRAERGRSAFITQQADGEGATSQHTNATTLTAAEIHHSRAAAKEARALERAQTQARLTALPRHVAERVPRITASAGRIRPLSANNHHAIASLAAGTATSAHDALQGDSVSAMLGSLDELQFASTAAKCAFLRARPELRRLFADRVDTQVREARRQRQTALHDRQRSAEAHDRMLAESYLSGATDSFGDGGTAGGAESRHGLLRSASRPPTALAATGGGNDPRSRERHGSFDLLSDSGSLKSATLKANNEYFEAALKASRALKRRQHQLDASVRRDGLQSWRTARAIDELQRPAFLKARRLREAEVELTENMWATLVTIALSLFEFHDRFTGALHALATTAASAGAPASAAHRAGQHQHQQHQQQSAAARLARFTGPHVAMQSAALMREKLRLVRATRCIERFWFKLRFRHFLRKKARAADLLRRFLHNLGESVRIPLAIRKKLRFVRALQSRFRSRAVLRAARRHLCVLQIRKSLAAALLDDEREVASLHSMLKQHERELSLKKGMHRVSKQESMAKMAATVNARIAFIAKRREASRHFTDELLFPEVDVAISRREAAFNDTVYRYGHAWKYFLALAGGTVADAGGNDQAQQIIAQRAQQQRQASQNAASDLSASLSRSIAVAEATSAQPPSMAAARRAAGGHHHAPAATTARLPFPKNPHIKPLRPYFRSLLTPDEVSAVVAAAVAAVGDASSNASGRGAATE